MFHVHLLALVVFFIEFLRLPSMVYDCIELTVKILC